MPCDLKFAKHKSHYLLLGDGSDGNKARVTINHIGTLIERSMVTTNPKTSLTESP